MKYGLYQSIPLLHHIPKITAIVVFQLFDELPHVIFPIQILYHQQDKSAEVKIFLFDKLYQFPTMLKDVDVMNIDDQQSLFNLAGFGNNPLP